MRRENESLVLGNGINYMSNNSVSWRDLLKRLAVNIRHKEIMDLIDEKPFTLIYEEIIFKSNKIGVSSEIDIKRKVAELVDEISPNSFHKNLLQSRFQHIITTNYDYALERSSEKGSKKSNVKRETKYNLYRRRSVDSKYVWHIHGESDIPNSITLGHEQYAGQLQKMRHYATSNRESRSGDVSQFKLNNMNFDKDGSDYSWLDLFFRDHIHILGLSLDYTEIDLWWLLSYKERLRRISGYNVGKTYYHTRKEKITKKKQGLLNILGSFGIEVVYHEGYEAMYKSVIKK